MDGELYDPCARNFGGLESDNREVIWRGGERREEDFESEAL